MEWEFLLKPKLRNRAMEIKVSKLWKKLLANSGLVVLTPGSPTYILYIKMYVRKRFSIRTPTQSRALERAPSSKRGPSLTLFGKKLIQFKCIGENK